MAAIRRRIFLIGQSAGAAHVASFLAMPDLHSRMPPVAGAAMLSGIYNVERLQHGPFENAYYGTDPSRFPEQSSLAGLIETQVPCLFTAAEYDPPQFQTQAALLAEAWFMRQRRPALTFSICRTAITCRPRFRSATGDALEGELAAFIRKHGEGNA